MVKIKENKDFWKARQKMINAKIETLKRNYNNITVQMFEENILKAFLKK